MTVAFTNCEATGNLVTGKVAPQLAVTVKPLGSDLGTGSDVGVGSDLEMGADKGRAGDSNVAAGAAGVRGLSRSATAHEQRACLRSTPAPSA